MFHIIIFRISKFEFNLTQNNCGFEYERTRCMPCTAVSFENAFLCLLWCFYLNFMYHINFVMVLVYYEAQLRGTEIGICVASALKVLILYNIFDAIVFKVG